MKRQMVLRIGNPTNTFFHLVIRKDNGRINYNRHPGFIGFCDFLVNSHWIGFMRGQEGILNDGMFGITFRKKLLSPFEEAIEMINSDADEFIKQAACNRNLVILKLGMIKNKSTF